MTLRHATRQEPPRSPLTTSLLFAKLADMAKQSGAPKITGRVTGRLAPVNITVNGATVSALRQLNGYGLKELAEASGVSMSYICEVERGTKSNLRPVTIKKLADALGVPVAALARDPEAAQAYFDGQVA